MKKLRRQAQKLEALNLFSLLQSSDGRNLYDPANRRFFRKSIPAW
jgi:hypothetical protein